MIFTIMTWISDMERINFGLSKPLKDFLAYQQHLEYLCISMMGIPKDLKLKYHQKIYQQICNIIKKITYKILKYTL